MVEEKKEDRFSDDEMSEVPRLEKKFSQISGVTDNDDEDWGDGYGESDDDNEEMIQTKEPEKPCQFKNMNTSNKLSLLYEMID